MTKIVLTQEQATILASAQDSVALCNDDGTVAAIIPPQSRFFAPAECPFSAEEIAAAVEESKSPGPWYTTHEVLDYLRSLDRSR